MRAPVPGVVTKPAGPANSSEQALGDREQRLRALMAQAMAGDEPAYCSLLVELSQHLRAFCRRRLAHMPAEVEDLVQETLLAIHNQRHTYDPGRPFTAWAHAIARYKLVDLLRRRSRREMLTDGLDHESELLGDTDLDASEAARDLGLLLQTLPDRQRLPIVHVKIDGLSVAEAAARTGMSVSAVKVGIHRGLRALAARLSNDR